MVMFSDCDRSVSYGSQTFVLGQMVQRFGEVMLELAHENDALLLFGTCACFAWVFIGNF